MFFSRKQICFFLEISRNSYIHEYIGITKQELCYDIL